MKDSTLGVMLGRNTPNDLEHHDIKVTSEISF